MQGTPGKWGERWPEQPAVADESSDEVDGLLGSSQCPAGRFAPSSK